MPPGFSSRIHIPVTPCCGGQGGLWPLPLFPSAFPSLLSPQIALLKILLAAAPTSKAKTDSINILADVLPEEMP